MDRRFEQWWFWATIGTSGQRFKTTLLFDSQLLSAPPSLLRPDVPLVRPTYAAPNPQWTALMEDAAPPRLPSTSVIPSRWMQANMLCTCVRFCPLGAVV
ncbi:hypothetical protein BRADI_1g57745v3 [Brachypodium distachyon]|uniref:Uncharacterized protein n=1 Tax=Brachypodium distachyon TaxID=15368 RepID=A0A2K2DS45_BRADI|nr:hypothetical protein BRADI_1g57745v3 [Brachypodium distachyon]